MDAIPTLLQQLADTLNALDDAGYSPDPLNGVHVGDTRPAPSGHPLRVVADDDTGRWIVAPR